MSAIFIADVRSRALSRGLTGLTIATAVFSFATVTWGTAGWSATLAKALGAPIGSPTCALLSNMVFCPRAPVGLKWRADDILRFVLADDHCHGRRCRLLVMQPVSYAPSLLWRAHAAESSDAPLSIERIRIGGNVFEYDFLLYIDLPDLDHIQVSRPTLAEYQAGHPEFSERFRLARSFDLPYSTARLLRRHAHVQADPPAHRSRRVLPRNDSRLDPLEKSQNHRD